MLSPFEAQALFLSLQVAAIGVAVSLPFGIALAWLLARHEFRGKLLLDSALHLPLILPPVVTGYALLLLFGRASPAGRWLSENLGINLAFDWKGAALVAAIMGLPLLVRPIRLAIEAADPGLEHAAATLGANRFAVLRTITLPLALPGIIAGTFLAFGRALGEFGATITFAANIPGQTQTLPLALYSVLSRTDGEPIAIRLALLSALLAIAALAASEILARRVARRLQGTA